MFWPQHWQLLLVAAFVLVSSATLAEVSSPWRMAAEPELSAASDDESCWGSREECPVVYDDDGSTAAAGLGRHQQPQEYHVAASLLPTPYYISYSAMTPDSVPCSVPGSSYYNCQPAGADGADANPYTRGCSAITQCRG